MGASLSHVRIRRSTPLLLLFALLAPAVASEERPVHDSPEAVQPLQPGARVPSATVRRVTGESLDLASLVSERGAMLVFYRGGW